MPEHPRSSGSASPRRPLLEPHFVVCLLFLAVAAVGLQPGLAALAARFQKLPIDLRKPLDQLGHSKLPTFVQVPVPANERPSVTDVGTKDLLLTRFISTDPRLAKLGTYLLVTYYSDPRDKVPHTPEVCYRQVGAVVEKLTTITINTPELAPKSPTSEVRLLILRQPDGYAAILYLFYVNGRLCYDREQVRRTIAWPGDRHVYFSKIEVTAPIADIANPTPAIECCRSLLREVLPLLVKEHFPDDAQLK